MFKIVREGTPDGNPSLLMMCDEACANVISMPIQMGEEFNLQLHNQFANEAAAQGWRVAFDRQLCPLHAKRLGEQIQASQRRIQLVGSIRDTALKVLKN